MDAPETLRELFGRLLPLVSDTVDGLEPDQLLHAPTTEANTIAWLIWHLSRVQDHHVADVMGVDQIWTGGDHAEAVGLRPDPSNTGYGHTVEQMSAVRPRSADALVEYYVAVDARTRAFLDDVTATDLDRIVDDNWDPPVTLGVRLVSVADDSLQHVGQAAYLRGLL